MRRFAIPALIVVGVLLVGTCIYFAARAHEQWSANCKSRGGHVSSHTTVTNGGGFDSKGNYVSTSNSNTTYYCITDDGRIIDIE